MAEMNLEDHGAFSEESISPAFNGRRRVVVSALVGNAIEFYDFIVYVFFAPYIGRAFFPAADRWSSLLLALAVFGVGFVARPVGAVVLGRYADLRGRRPAMLLTIWLITGATCVMAVLPTYSDVGMAAAVLLTGCRLIQGFCFGGEVGPSIAYLAEVAPAGRRGLYCAGLFAGQGVAALAGGSLGMVLTSALSAEQMQNWGWRVPFLVAAVAMPFALVLRRDMPESFKPKEVTRGIAQPPATRLAALSLAILGGTVANYVCSYLPTYAKVTLGMQATAAISVTIAVGAATFVFGLLGGWLADRHGQRTVLLVSRFACTLFALPLFAWLSGSPSMTALWLTATLLAATNAVNGGALFALMAESFSPGHRAKAIAIVYAVGVAIFGGSTQFVVAWLGESLGSPLVPAWYVLITGAIALASLWTMQLPNVRPVRSAPQMLPLQSPADLELR